VKEPLATNGESPEVAREVLRVDRLSPFLVVAQLERRLNSIGISPIGAKVTTGVMPVVDEL
jgi:hypothetical protein